MSSRLSPARALLTTLLLCAVTTAALLGRAPVAHAQPAASARVETLSSTYLDELGRPTPELVAQISHLANQPWMPSEARSLLLTATAFFTGHGESDGGVPLPEEAPTFTQFYWPSVSGNCMGDGLHSTASAIAVPGPAEIPAPGAEAGQTAYVYTALGTAPAAGPEVPQDLTVRWFNLDTLTYGETPLANHGINPEGPATLSGVGNTGTGTILALAEGSIATTEYTCSFIPTVALIEAP